MHVGFGLLMQFFTIVGRVLIYLVINPGPLLPVAVSFVLGDYLLYNGVSSLMAWAIAILAGVVAALLRWRFTETVQFIANLPEHLANFINDPATYLNRDIVCEQIEKLLRNGKFVGALVVAVLLCLSITISRQASQHAYETSITKTYVAATTNDIIDNNASGGSTGSVKVTQTQQIEVGLPGCFLAGVKNAKAGWMHDVEQSRIDHASKYVEIDTINMQPADHPHRMIGPTSPDCLRRTDDNEPSVLIMTITLPPLDATGGAERMLCSSIIVSITGWFGECEKLLLPTVMAEINGMEYELAVERMYAGEVVTPENDRGRVDAYRVNALSAILQNNIEYCEVVGPVTVKWTFPSGDVATRGVSGEIDTLFVGDSVNEGYIVFELGA